MSPKAIRPVPPPVPPGVQARDYYQELFRNGKIAKLPKIPSDGRHCNGFLRSNPKLYCRLPPGYGTAHLGEGRCRFHGGNTPRGVASPCYKPRDWRSNLPSRIGEAYEAAMNDPDLLHLHREVALCEARMKELAGELSPGAARAGFPKLRKQLTDLQAKVRKTQKTEDLEKIQRELLDGIQFLFALSKEMASDVRLWGEIGTWMDRRQRMAEAEMRQLATARAMIDGRELIHILERVVEIFRIHVKDPKLTAAMAKDIAVMAGALKHPSVYKGLNV